MLIGDARRSRQPERVTRKVVHQPSRRWQAALACGAAKLRLDPESLKRHTWPGPVFGLDGRFDMTHASAPVGTRVFLCFAMPW